MTDPRPGGTVYGRGGADVREPRRRGLHPAVLALVAAAAVLVVAAAVFLVTRDPGDVPVRATPAAAPPPPTVAPPSPEPSPERRETPLQTGDWQVSLAGDPEKRLKADGDFAAVASGDALTLTLVPGLADKSCFSFRRGDDDYLRHFDYRLRFDQDDDSPLFRDDATFCPEGGAAIRLRSKNYPDHFLHRRGAELYIDEPDGTAEFVADSSFALHEPSS